MRPIISVGSIRLIFHGVSKCGTQSSPIDSLFAASNNRQRSILSHCALPRHHYLLRELIDSIYHDVKYNNGQFAGRLGMAGGQLGSKSYVDVQRKIRPDSWYGNGWVLLDSFSTVDLVKSCRCMRTSSGNMDIMAVFIS